MKVRGFSQRQFLAALSIVLALVATVPLLYSHSTALPRDGWLGIVSVTNLSHYTDQYNDLKTSSYHSFGVQNESEEDDLSVGWAYHHSVHKLIGEQELEHFWANDNANGNITVAPLSYFSSSSISASPTRRTSKQAQEGKFRIKAYTSLTALGQQAKDSHERDFIQDGGG